MYISAPWKQPTENLIWLLIYLLFLLFILESDLTFDFLIISNILIIIDIIFF